MVTQTAETLHLHTLHICVTKILRKVRVYVPCILATVITTVRRVCMKYAVIGLKFNRETNGGTLSPLYHAHHPVG